MQKILIFYIIIIMFLTQGFSTAFASEIKKEIKNKDGKVNTWAYYDKNNKPIRIESDRNLDGKLDLWVFYRKNGIKVTQIDRNFDGKPDMFIYYQFGERTKLGIDADYDGKLDQVNEYMGGRLVKIRKAGKDGKLKTVFDITSRYSPKQKHTEYYETYPQTLGDSKALPKKQKTKQE